MPAHTRRPWSDAWAAFWADRFVKDMKAAIEDFSTTIDDRYKAWHEAILLVCTFIVQSPRSYPVLSSTHVLPNH